jgi:hypothetical protein
VGLELFSPDPDPAFQVIPDLDPILKLGQVSDSQIFIVHKGELKQDFSSIFKHLKLLYVIKD